MKVLAMCPEIKQELGITAQSIVLQQRFENFWKQKYAFMFLIL